MIQRILAWIREKVKSWNDLPPYGCGCILPGQHCPDCEAAAREVYGGDELPF